MITHNKGENLNGIDMVANILGSNERYNKDKSREQWRAVESAVLGNGEYVKETSILTILQDLLITPQEILEARNEEKRRAAVIQFMQSYCAFNSFTHDQPLKMFYTYDFIRQRLAALILKTDYSNEDIKSSLIHSVADCGLKLAAANFNLLMQCSASNPEYSLKDKAANDLIDTVDTFVISITNFLIALGLDPRKFKELQ